MKVQWHEHTQWSWPYALMSFCCIFAITNEEISLCVKIHTLLWKYDNLITLSYY